ncbi:hypothetical protein MTO96_027074 [Rhipicephalus appendiculatus]
MLAWGPQKPYDITRLCLLNNLTAPLLLANGSLNPIKRSVYWWYGEWRDNKYGPAGNPVAKLQEKAATYAADGTGVFTTSISDDCWAAVVVTPIMHRAQSLESAKDIIFVDSTSSCDTEGNAATVLLTATKAGAVPVALLVHSSQTRERYRAAFQLLFKDKYPSCFGNNKVHTSAC